MKGWSRYQTNMRRFYNYLSTTKKLFKLSMTLDRVTKKLSSSKMNFVDSVYKEYIQRELDKDYTTKHLNIKLEKLVGYNSATDFYTFCLKFDKLYLEKTPKRLLPDLLKNNHLGDPALTLVKSLDNIDEIWEKLKKAYGNTRPCCSRSFKPCPRQTQRKREILKNLYTHLASLPT